MYRSIGIKSLLVITFLGVIQVLNAADLPIIDLSARAPLALQNLPWEFYWQKYIEPGEFSEQNTTPDLILTEANVWNNLKIGGQKLGSYGFATFRVRFSVHNPGERLGLRVPSPLSSCRIFINGEKLAENGIPGTDATSTWPRRKSSLVFFSTRQGEVEIVIHVANYLLYKGGLRNSMELGPAEIMQTYGTRYLSIDLFCLGLIFSIMLYHFLLFFLSRRDFSSLLFAFVALDYFFLASTYSEQPINLLFPEIPLALHIRLAAFCAYLLPPLVVEFTARLYPGTIARGIRLTFWGGALLLACFLVLPARYFMFYNVIYYGIAGFAGGLISLQSTLRAAREGRGGARLLTIGIAILFALTLYTIYLFTTHSQAGSFLSIGFSLFALMQSGSLAHAHAVLSHENRSMLERLERSRSALENQRRQIEANLHDSLGGNLTDIKLGLEAMEQNPAAQAVRRDIRQLDQRVSGTIASLRTELLFLEDMQLAMKDFVSGINLILLRRYQMAKRPVEIDISPQTRERGKFLQKTGILSDERIPELCMVVQELCNNSLKYTAGTTHWQIKADASHLSIKVQAKSRQTKGASGLGRDTLRRRSETLGARFSHSLEGGKYQAVFELP